MEWKAKRKQLVDTVVEIYDLLDPDGYNGKRFREKMEAMSEKEFASFIKLVKSGAWKASIEMPNLKSSYDMEKIYKAADKLGVKIFTKVRMFDQSTGVHYLTNKEYPVLSLPIRRAQQTIDHKMALPDGDTHIDAMTGQVTGPDHAARTTKPEVQILDNRGLKNTMKEFLQVRGGNPDAYAEFKQQLEETGEANIDTAAAGRTRTAQTAGILLKGMHIDSNLDPQEVTE